MEPFDRRLLQVLAGAGESFPLSVSVLASETGHDEQTVGVRCDDLADRGLVGRAGPNAYYLRDAGREYVAATDDAADADPLPVDVGDLPSWMERGDLRVLAALDDADGAVSTDELAAACDALDAYVERRCDRLAAEGLVQPVWGEGYELRDLGAALLAGEVDAAVFDSPSGPD